MDTITCAFHRFRTPVNLDKPEGSHTLPGIGLSTTWADESSGDAAGKSSQKGNEGEESNHC
jgi:hypothetical protein